MKYARINCASESYLADGMFVNVDTGNYFEYSDHWDTGVMAVPINKNIKDRKNGPKRMFDHRIYVGQNGETVLSAHMSTKVAYVIVGKDEDGEYIVEKWNIKRGRHPR